MGKRAILSAAKKRGITIRSAEYYWAVTPGEMVPEWQIQFGPELDDEIEFFDNAAQAVEFINNAELIAALRQAALVPEAKHPDDGNGDDGAYNRGWNDCREAMLATHPAAAVDEAVSRAYDAGFRVAANWMERDDLHADCGSQAYAEDKAAALHAGQEVGRG